MNKRGYEMSKFPKTPKQFESLIDDQWVKKILPADEDDSKKFKTVYFLKDDKECIASVSFEYGRVFVNCDKKGIYHFDLDRILEGFEGDDGFEGWNWYKQLQGKSWVKSEALEFLLVLFNIFGKVKAYQ